MRLCPHKTVEMSAPHVERFALGNVFVREAEGFNLQDFYAVVFKRAQADDFCFVLLPASLMMPKCQDDIGLPTFDAKKRQKRFYAPLGFEISYRPAPKRSSFFGMLRFFAKATAEYLDEKFQSLSVNHADLNAGVIARSRSALALVGFCFLNS